MATKVVLGEDVQRGELEGYKIVAGVFWQMALAWKACALVVAEPRTGDLAWDMVLDHRLLVELGTLA
jgi:hypothetical protein